MPNAGHSPITPLIRTLQSIAERLGVNLTSTGRAGIRYWSDLSRIRPLQAFRQIIDVGAHRGETAREFAVRFPNATIYSFEPERANYDALVAATGDLGDRVRCICSAVSNDEGEKTLYRDADSHWHSLRSDAVREGTDTALVQTRTLDAFWRSEGSGRVDLLKTDTQGNDLNVLRGAEPLLVAGRVDFVYTEVGFSPMETASSFFPSVLSYLGEQGFHFLGLYDGFIWERPWRLGYANALFVHGRVSAD
jgi:FkbM family methyltransferase